MTQMKEFRPPSSHILTLSHSNILKIFLLDLGKKGALKMFSTVFKQLFLSCCQKQNIIDSTFGPPNIFNENVLFTYYS